MPSPVETQYGDYRYHSRLGARWAVFFDLLRNSIPVQTDSIYPD